MLNAYSIAYNNSRVNRASRLLWSKQQLFLERIKRKVKRDKENLESGLDGEQPSIVRCALKPLVGLAHDVQDWRNSLVGRGGEAVSLASCWLALPNNWVLVSDAVLEPEPEEFAQIDSVAIGPPGIYLLEVKTWQGAFKGYKDRWWRRKGNEWVPCSSPTRQNMRHKRLFLNWLKSTGISAPDDLLIRHIFPVVMLLGCSWLRVDQCSMPVLSGAFGLGRYFREQVGKERVFESELIESVAGAVVEDKPFCAQYGVEQAETIALGGGKECLRILGSQDSAELVRKVYAARGKTTSRLFPDRYEPGWWCFYVT